MSAYVMTVIIFHWSCGCDFSWDGSSQILLFWFHMNHMIWWLDNVSRIGFLYWLDEDHGPWWSNQGATTVPPPIRQKTNSRWRTPCKALGNSIEAHSDTKFKYGHDNVSFCRGSFTLIMNSGLFLCLKDSSPQMLKNSMWLLIARSIVTSKHKGGNFMLVLNVTVISRCHNIS